MNGLIQNDLAHILWIGGATDAGKTTATRAYAKRHNFLRYEYDRSDGKHHDILATHHDAIRKAHTATLDERWIDRTYQELFDYLFTLFPLRFELVLEELRAQSKDKVIVVEGFGLLPELVCPHLSSTNQALWFVPTREFKLASMERRGKPSFGSKTRDPKLAKHNHSHI